VSFSTNQALREEGPHRPDDGKDKADRDQEVVEQSLAHADLAPEDLEVEQQRQDNTDGEAQGGSHECHDAIELREGDGDGDERDDDEDPDSDLEDAARVPGQAGEARRAGEGLWIEPRENLDGRDDGPGIERNFGQRDDGNAYTHDYREGAWVSGSLDEIGRDFCHDAVTKHEDSHNCGCTV